jgi:riboflavin synthase
MFTGIVEELGSIAARNGPRLRINAINILEDVRLGDSIAVNGCCLTVVEWDAAPADYSTAAWW